jgi:hypothetical protein
MNIRLTNQLNMISASLNVARSQDHAHVWTGQEPAAFGNDLATLETGYKTALSKSVLANASNGGAADTKAQAETTLEDCAYVLARALAVHFKKTNDLTRRAHVDVSHSEIVQLRENDLVTKATTIRDLGMAARSEPEAGARGVSSARVEALTQAITAFKLAMGTPRGQIVNRSTLLRELETDTAALLEQLYDLDDLVLQFDGSAQGQRFSAAWKKARIIVDRVAEQSAKTPVLVPASN